jgi:hypothetical protein
MGELTTGHVVLDAALIVAMMLVLHWMEWKRNRAEHRRQDRHVQLDVRPSKKAA